MNIRNCLLITAASLTLSTVLSAQESAPPASESERRAKAREKILAKFDANGDGKLDDAEKAALRQAFEGKAGTLGARRKLLEKFDTNGDGRIDDTERAAARELIQQKKATAPAA